ncbi:dysbindin domain containing 1 [Ictidomys tridecemlineatus]|uniref:dysbindin domain-containing protein 1 n=1 Tax=Ictidomys tridecemlineatus TaxID=43179 RepID=UPI000B53FE01|nr:dysbindin domain-containing protein 1 [Ictidomys tridecemlineatus]KAG3256636.1 dysbindin domain containing 1 [Ictidomys tridecemlineatus]
MSPTYPQEVAWVSGEGAPSLPFCLKPPLDTCGHCPSLDVRFNIPGPHAPLPRPNPRGLGDSPSLDGKILLVAEIIKEVEVPPAALGVPAHGTESSCHTPVAEEEVGIPIPAPGLLQVTERRQPLSSVSSLEVHFDLLDLTELTDMSDQELAEVFADSDEENLTSESPAGLHPLPRAGCLRSPSWTKTRAEQNREKQPLSDPERQAAIVDTFLTVERPKED